MGEVERKRNIDLRNISLLSPAHALAGNRTCILSVYRTAIQLSHNSWASHCLVLEVRVNRLDDASEHFRA